mgnify:CR=1 FL=1
MSASATVFEESQSGEFGTFIVLILVASQVLLMSIAREFFKNGSWPERMGTEWNDAGSGEWLMNKLSK